MLHHKLIIQTSSAKLPDGFSKLIEADFETLAHAVKSILPDEVLKVLHTSYNAPIIPLVICTHSQGASVSSMANMLALYSRRACSLADNYSEMCGEDAWLPIMLASGSHLTEWFIENVNLYYSAEVTRPLRIDGEGNSSYDAGHRAAVPIADYAALSLEHAYMRLVAAVADLDDDGNTHEVVGHVRAITSDQSSAGVQLIHLEADNSVSTCFVPFSQLVADADKWVMF